MSRAQRQLRNARIGAVLAVIAMLVTAHQLGILEQFADPPRLKQALIGLGGWGYLAFIVAYTVLQPFGVPGTVFVMAAPLIWSWPVAFVLSMTGTMAASVVGFSFARFVARDAVSALIPKRFRKYEDALARRGFATVFILRLIFWMPPMLHAFFGVSKVSFSKHFWGSLAGYLPTLLLISYFGEALFDWMKSASVETWIGLGAAAVVIGLAFWLFQRRSARAEKPGQIRGVESGADSGGR